MLAGGAASGLAYHLSASVAAHLSHLDSDPNDRLNTLMLHLQAPWQLCRPGPLPPGGRAGPAAFTLPESHHLAQQNFDKNPVMSQAPWRRCRPNAMPPRALAWLLTSRTWTPVPAVRRTARTPSRFRSHHRRRSWRSLRRLRRRLALRRLRLRRRSLLAAPLDRYGGNTARLRCRLPAPVMQVSGFDYE